MVKGPVDEIVVGQKFLFLIFSAYHCSGLRLISALPYLSAYRLIPVPFI
jgi:hypothetical protein